MSERDSSISDPQRRRRIRGDATPSPTLQEVAERAGVSEITVSRVMRDAANVSKTTRERVLAAVKEVGYVRNRLAGQLAGHRSSQIAVILPSLSNIVFPDVLNGAEEALETSGFHPVLGISNYDFQREERLIESLLSWRPAGIITVGANHTGHAVQMLKTAEIPIVELMDIDINPIDMAVGISHRQAGKSMAYYLLGRGYNHFGYVGHDIEQDERAGFRLQGFNDALIEAGKQPASVQLLSAPSSVALGREGLAKLLKESATRSQPLEVVYFSNDDMATGGVFHCMAEGIDIPSTLAIAGFNGLDIGQQLPIPLTTIGSHRHLIGKRAAEQILAKLDGKPTESVVDVGFTLIPGASA